MRRLLNRLRGRLGSALQSDDDFIEEAYQRILGRPVDPKGREHYRAAFREGLGRIDLLLELTQSDELTSKLAKAARVKAGPRALFEERYRELVDRTNGQIVPIFEAQSPQDFDWLETRILEDRYYEKPGVWNLEVDLDKRVVAEMLASFDPKRALELGCAAGAVVECLVDYGVAAGGVDISLMALDRAASGIRKRLHHGDLLSFDFAEPYDMLFGLDIFEHLNPNRIDTYVNRLGQIVMTGGYLFCNIPAFGRDPVFGTVFPYYIDGWESDAAAGRPFSRLHVDSLGYPLHGHLTWADASWWVDRFVSAGFARQPGIEHALHAKYDEHLKRTTPARRAFFVFAKAASVERTAAIVQRISTHGSRVLENSR